MGQEVDIMFFNLLSFEQREILGVICPFPVHVTADAAVGLTSVTPLCL